MLMLYSYDTVKPVVKIANKLEPSNNLYWVLANGVATC